jgi:hypothetical protein
MAWSNFSLNRIKVVPLKRFAELPSHHFGRGVRAGLAGYSADRFFGVLIGRGREWLISDFLHVGHQILAARFS